MILMTPEQAEKTRQALEMLLEANEVTTAMFPNQWLQVSFFVKREGDGSVSIQQPSVVPAR